MSSLKVDAWDEVSRTVQLGKSVAKDLFDIRTAIKGTNHLSQGCLDALEAALKAEANSTKAQCITDINNLLTP